MKAAEKEVEQLERKAHEDAGLVTKDKKKGKGDGEGSSQELTAPPPIALPSFKTLRAQRRIAAQ